MQRGCTCSLCLLTPRVAVTPAVSEEGGAKVLGLTSPIAHILPHGMLKGNTNTACLHLQESLVSGSVDGFVVASQAGSAQDGHSTSMGTSVANCHSMTRMTLQGVAHYRLWHRTDEPSSLGHDIHRFFSADFSSLMLGPA